MKTQKGISTIAGITIFVVVAVFTFGGVFAYEYYLEKNEQKAEGDQQTEPIACTMEAKICPDGSSVGRTGPNCEFAECPIVDQTAGWKTYTNAQYGFEIKYPNDFYTNPLDAKYDQNTTDVRLNSPFELEQIKYSYKLSKLNSITTFYLDSQEYKNSGFQFAYFNVGIDEDQSDIVTCTTLVSGASSSGMSQKTPVNINGINFYRYKLFDDAMGGQRGTGYVYFGVINNKCIVMHGFHAYRDSRGFSDVQVNFDDSEISEISEKLNEIASNFKFTN